MARKIIFSDAPFVASHGRVPKGRGSWAFSLERNPRDILADVAFAPVGTFTEAKAWARVWADAEAARRGVPSARAIVVFAQP